MPAWMYTSGHIGWALFACLVYSGVAVLGADYIWRRVTMPGKILFAIVAGAWLLGVVVLSLVL